MIEGQPDFLLEPPISEPKRVTAVNPQDINFQMDRTTRLFHAAGVARICDEMFYKFMDGQEGKAEIVITDHGKKHKTTVLLTESYVSHLKHVAFQAYLDLYDIKPEGVEVARQVLDNIRGIDRSPVTLIDHIDHWPANDIDPGGPVD